MAEPEQTLGIDDIVAALLRAEERGQTDARRALEAVTAMREQVTSATSTAERAAQATGAQTIQGARTPDGGISFRLAGRHWTIGPDGKISSAAG